MRTRLACPTQVLTSRNLARPKPVKPARGTKAKARVVVDVPVIEYRLSLQATG